MSFCKIAAISLALLCMLCLASCAARLNQSAEIAPWGQGHFLLVMHGNFMGSGTPCGTLPQRYDDSDYILLPGNIGIFDAAQIGLYFDEPKQGGSSVWKEKNVKGTVQIDEMQANVQLELAGYPDGVTPEYKKYRYNGIYTVLRK